MNMGEDKKLAIVFSKSQCSRYPKAHYTYKDRFGKPLKMSIVRLPSKLYRPSGLDFGVFDGVNRNEVLAYINVPWDMIKKDKNNENRRFSIWKETSIIFSLSQVMGTVIKLNHLE